MTTETTTVSLPALAGFTFRHFDRHPTCALRVYEDCGFKPVKTEIVYRKSLT